MNLLEQLPVLRQLPPDVQALVMRLLLLFVVLALILLLRRAIAPLLLRPLERLVARTPNKIDDIVLQTALRPLRVVLIAFAIFTATAVLDFGPEVQRLATNISRALVIAAVIIAIYNLIHLVSFTSETLRSVTGISIEERLLPFLRVVVKTFVVVMGGLIIMQEFGFDVSGLIASFGIVGLAFSLAAQDTAANVFGFTAIVSDNPFKVGDFIVTKDFEGIVEHVGVRSTRVRRLDQSLVTVPNSALTNTAVTNWSRLARRRIDFYIGLTYSTSSQQMRDVLEQIREMLRARPNIDPETVVARFVRFGDSSLDIRIIAYVLVADWNSWTAEIEEINLALLDIVENAGLSFAFPSRSLYIEAKGHDRLLRPPVHDPRQALPASGAGDEQGRDNPNQANDSEPLMPR